MTVKEMGLPWQHGGPFLSINTRSQRVISFVTNSCYDPAAMSEITNQLIYEVLKSIQAQVAIIREDVDSIKNRLTAQDARLSQVLGAMAGLHGDLAEVSGRIDRLESRMGRVETRLNLSDA